jgi:hypothetical protein
MLVDLLERIQILTMRFGGGKNNCDVGVSDKNKSDEKKKRNTGDGRRRSSGATKH